MDSLTLAAHCVTKGHHSRSEHDTFCRGPLHYQACRLDKCEQKDETARLAGGQHMILLAPDGDEQ